MFVRTLPFTVAISLSRAASSTTVRNNGERPGAYGVDMLEDEVLTIHIRVSSLTFTSRASARRPVRARSSPHPASPDRSPPLDRLITSKDHASVQINVADVDANGRAQNTHTTFAFSGQVRAMGESDDSLNRLATKAGCECIPGLIENEG